jgi:hypothetical protein
MSRSLTPGLARDLRTTAIAVFATLLLTATPSIAAKVKNADRVDGKHAVAAKASPAKRAGKLVATDRSGHLPGDIIVKAPDADRLDGQDSSAFRPRTAGAGEVMTGVFALVTTHAATSPEGTAANFPAALSTALPASRTTVVPPGGSTVQCPGAGQVTPNGWLCIYQANAFKVSGMNVFDPATTFPGVNRDGFELQFTCDSGTCILEGTYAVRAPS